MDPELEFRGASLSFSFEKFLNTIAPCCCVMFFTLGEGIGVRVLLHVYIGLLKVFTHLIGMKEMLL